jgi:hypothetical protein
MNGWLSQGGEKNNLTESTLLGLFVSGYEKKPSLTFPIQVVEPKNVPEDLRNSVEDLRRAHTWEDPLKDSEPYKVLSVSAWGPQTSQHRWMKMYQLLVQFFTF